MRWAGRVRTRDRLLHTDVAKSPKVRDQLQTLFGRHGVRTVVVAIHPPGCPHEVGEDFPIGEDCPFCPFWEGRQGGGEEW